MEYVWPILLFLLWSLIDSISVYRLFKKRHYLFDDRFTKNMCMAISMISAFVCALYLQLLLSADHSVLFMLPVASGLFIGWRYGAIIKSPASLTGIYNGAMGGVMGMMMGAVLENPALCNIPIENSEMIKANMYSLSILAVCVHALISQLIRYSFRV